MLAAKSATLLCQFSGRLCVHNQACILIQQDSAKCSKQHTLLQICMASAAAILTMAARDLVKTWYIAERSRLLS